jgi:galactose mutarotase-like enzyme
MNELTLESPGCTARIFPREGARVQSLVDRGSGRELLYQRDPGDVPREDFLTCSTGGWDLLFPNDPPWRGLPDHGVVWSAPFAAGEQRADAAELRATLERPPVDVIQRLALLPSPRRGLRISTVINAHAATEPFLLAYHPMLAVDEGWRIDCAAAELVADDELPGRFRPGPLDPSASAIAARLPAGSAGLAEVIYADGASEAVVRSPDGRDATRVSWDPVALSHLWIVVVAGELDIDLSLLFEPCTSRPYGLDDAIAARTARSLLAGESISAWCEVESLDA